MGIRIGIVGAGTTVAIADRHVEGFLAQEGRCTVAAVCSRTLEGCRRLCIRHGLDGVRMTTRLEELLDVVDAVVLCTPNQFHLPYTERAVERGKAALSILQAANVDVQEVTEQALRQEWGSLDLNVVVVEDMDAAIAHIREYGTQHSESILTENQRLATQFINQVDAAAVYVNASTRFTDGGQFGLGAEVAVSTQKLHARGPMGLEALTSYKWVCVGDYTSRQ